MVVGWIYDNRVSILASRSENCQRTVTLATMAAAMTVPKMFFKNEFTVFLS